MLSRNFGHQSAYTAGLTYARGDQIAMMDGDLQDPPELLPAMFEKLRAGNLDVVFGKRIEREEKWPKKQLIDLFHRTFQRVLPNQDVENAGNFSIFSKRVAQAMLSLQEKNRYLPGLRLFVGFKQGSVEYRRPDRKEGTAKMTLAKLVRLAFDAFFSFTDLPLKVCLYSGILGVITFFFGLFITVISQSFRNGSLRLVVNGAEHLLFRLGAACLSGDTGRICVQNLPGDAEPPAVYSAGVYRIAGCLRLGHQDKLGPRLQPRRIAELLIACIRQPAAGLVILLDGLCQLISRGHKNLSVIKKHPVSLGGHIGLVIDNDGGKIFPAYLLEQINRHDRALCPESARPSMPRRS